MTTEPRGGTLGTFTGVFTPSILTILGIILFLRLGYVVGSAGLRSALFMIGLATLVAVLTSISLSTIATNIEVKGGGDYYLISRTLGVEFGGAIGIVLYLAQTVSIAFYAIGFGEAVSAIAGWSASWGPQVIAAAAVAVLFLFAWAGADVATRFQFVVMAVLVAALISFFVGAIEAYDPDTASRAMAPARDASGFWVVFAILFPAVTGFTQGVSMSGDLRSPGKSLPRGTFSAVGVSTVVYVAAAVLLAGSVSRQTLISDPSAMGQVALFSPLIDAGVIAATLSSAMASFLGAPRILQSMAKDKVFPILRPFAAGFGPTGNPRAGVLLSLVLAMATIALGSLDAIAPVVSMFFLVSYGLLNYATYYEAHAQSPSFRPRFRFFHRRLSLLGAIACLGVMLAINPAAGAGAVLLMYLIYQYLSRSDRADRWTDTSQAHFFQRAKESIQAMTGKVDHARNWRPQILAFSADPTRRERLLRFTSWLEGGSGITAVAQIVAGEGVLKRRLKDEVHLQLEAQIEALGIGAHALTVLAPDPLDALPIVVQSFGIGPLKANTVVFGLSSTSDEDRNRSYRMAVRSVGRLGANVVAVSSDERSWSVLTGVKPSNRLIDVWWSDDDSARLSLLTAYLSTRTSEWGRARIRLVVPIDATTDPTEVESAMSTMLDDVRIEADVVLVDARTTADLVATSAVASMVMVPMVLKGTGMRDALFLEAIDDINPHLPLVAAVMAATPIDLAAGPETGSHAELLAAEEQLESVKERLRVLKRQQSEAHSDLERLRDEGKDDPLLAGEIEVAQARVEEMARRVMQATGRIEVATRDLEAVRLMLP